MKLRSICTTRRQRPDGAIPSTRQEYRLKSSVSIDPTVGSGSNFLQEFPEAVFHEVAMNLYDTSTASRRGHFTEKTRVPAQEFHFYRSDRWIGLKFFHEFPEAVCHRVACNRYDKATASGRGHSTDNTRLPAQEFCIYRSDHWIALKFFSGVSGGCSP